MKEGEEYTFESRLSQKTLGLTFLLVEAFLLYKSFDGLTVLSFILLTLFAIILTLVISILSWRRYASSLLINRDRIFLKKYEAEPLSIYFADIAKIEIKRFSINIHSFSASTSFHSDQYSIQNIERIIRRVKESNEEFLFAIERTNSIF